jgi:hypothetical protein
VPSVDDALRQMGSFRGIVGRSLPIEAHRYAGRMLLSPCARSADAGGCSATEVVGQPLDPGVRGCSIGNSALQAADIIVNDTRSGSRDFALGAYRIGGDSW